MEPGAPDATVDAHAYPAKPTGQNERDITGRRSTGRCRERSRPGWWGQLQTAATGGPLIWQRRQARSLVGLRSTGVLGSGMLKIKLSTGVQDYKIVLRALRKGEIDRQMVILGCIL